MAQLIEMLNAPEAQDRLEALRQLKKEIDGGRLPKPKKLNYVNNHIHTAYSFSPYSPTKAVWMAYQAGLGTAGIVDHDSIGGAGEFIEAGKIIGMATTIGIEARVGMADTPLERLRINNPDQIGTMYMLIHGIPHTQIDTVQAFFAPYRAKRNARNIKMTAKINDLLGFAGIALDFEKEVLPLSLYEKGGSVTERHITYALAKKVIAQYGTGAPLVAFLIDTLKLNIPEKIKGYLLDKDNVNIEYDLLGLFKSEFVPKFYIDATDELPPVRDFVALGSRVGAIVACPYLGDVGQSITGDKKAQKFEDDYLELVFDVIDALGINAVAYMPSRNTMAQLARVRALCDRYQKIQISGEDINQPRQSFICKALDNPVFSNLIYNTYALIGHERAATNDITDGIFSAKTVAKMPDLSDRLKYFHDLAIKDN